MFYRTGRRRCTKGKYSNGEGELYRSERKSVTVTPVFSLVKIYELKSKTDLKII